jgi:hypothetical protein
MTAPFGADFRPRQDNITIPTVWVAFALSVLIHAAALFGLVPKPHIPFQEPKLANPSGSLAIRLVPHTAPPVSSPPAAQSAPVPRPRAEPSAQPPRKSQPARQARPAQPSPPVIAMQEPAAAAPKVPPPAEAPRPAPGEDMASYIASRRRSREGAAAAPSPQPAETEQERHNRIVAENLGLTNTPSFGNDPERGGGVFQVRSMGYDIAEFAFFGWNKAINRNSLQVIEVRRGSNENMEIAVVRRMISIVRERSSGDFLWQSRRLGRGIWLSARPADTAELEAFILKELFPEPKPGQ